VKPWSGVRQSKFGAACMQNPTMANRMAPGVPLSEDCLFIDVWTPARTPGEKLPVIAWIYGGGFTGGMTSAPLYDGKNFASKGVVLGHSAGGFAVSMLAGSPLAKGLFRGVISESGANFMPPEHSRWAGGSIETLQAAEAAGKKWLDSLGAPTLAQARALPAEKVDEAQRAEGAPRFWPPVDGYVIKADQYELWRQGRFNDTPILTCRTRRPPLARTRPIRPRSKRMCAPDTGKRRMPSWRATLTRLTTPMARLTGRFAARAKRLTC